MESETQPLISLDEYDAAWEPVTRSDNPLHLLPALGGFLLAVYCSFFIGQHYFPDDDPGNLWKVMIGPFIAALVTAPWLFRVVRSRDRIADWQCASQVSKLQMSSIEARRAHDRMLR